MFSSRILPVLAIPVFVLLLAIAALALRLSQEEKASQAVVDHTRSVMGATKDVRSDVESAQLAELGHQVSGAQVSLDATHAALKSAELDLKKLQDMTSDNPHQQQRMAQLKPLLASLARVIEQEAAIVQSSPPPAGQPAETARLRPLMSEALALVDRISLILNEAVAEETSLLAQRTTRTHGLERSTLDTALIGALFTLALLGAAAVLLLRSNTRLAQLEAARTRQATILQATLDSIRDGIAVFEADMTLAAFNPNFFTLADFPQPLAEIGTPLERFRVAEEGREHKLFPNETVAEEHGTRRLVVSNRNLEVYAATVPNEGALIAVVDVTPAAKSSSPANEDAPIMKRPRRALVVEDIALVRMSTADMVGEIGLAVAEAGNGQEALDILAKDKEIDVLVTDLGLPGMTGAELIREARRRNPELIVVVISGYSRDTKHNTGVPHDARFLMKPFDATQLRSAIFGT